MNSLPVYYKIMDMISEKDGIDRFLIEKVVSHEARLVRDKMSGSCESIEISGFGTFYFNKKKAIKKLKDLDDIICNFEDRIERGDESKRSRGHMLIKIHELKSDRIRLKKKIDEVESKADL